MKPQAEPTSPWSPFAFSVFRWLWLATAFSNIGTFMQSVGAAWLMTSLSKSPVMVALVQAASSLPLFLLALPAGALADIVDRRRLLLVTQIWMTAAAAILGVLTLLGSISPWVLLSLTFLLGLGAALNGPPWQAIVPELVPRPELSKAIALNSAGFNLSRAVGPAAGGAVVAAAGSGATFILNALSFLGVMVVLYRWQRPVTVAALPAERMLAGMSTGLRYVRHAPILRAVLVQSGLVMFFASSLWALLPLVARYELGGGPLSYGILLACFGGGAVVGALIMPRMGQFVSVQVLIALMAVVFAAMDVVLALVPILAPLGVAMFISGGAWLVMVSTFNVAVQTAVASWIRARALAVYMLVFAGALGAGSAVWGAVATHQGIPPALLYSALGMVLSLAAMFRYRLEIDEDLDMTPSLHWPEPHLVLEPKPEEGPILVMVEYFIDAQESQAFSQAMGALGAIRRRDGAIRWELFQDAAKPGRFLETFIVETWVEHLRQHARMTVADRSIEERAFSFHLASTRPKVSHLVYAYGRRRGKRRFFRKI